MIFRIFWGGFRAILRALRYTVLFFLFSFFVQRSTYPLWVDWNAVSAIVRDYQFDYVSWELNALAAKAGQLLWGEHPYMDEATRSDFVRNYITDLRTAQQLEGQIAAIFSDPTIENPEIATADLRAERDLLRDDLQTHQSLAESILEGQVSSILVEEGFGTWGQLTPPMSMRFTKMPNLLVVSPRDEIRREVELTIDPMPLEDIVTAETRIEEELGLSPIVVPLGGMALYPAMIQESANLPWLVETFAHEWVHHYFFFYPLGMNYFSGNGGEAVAINETTADTFGKEIRELVLARYYPEFITAAAQPEYLHVSNLSQPTFDFGRTMHVTRVVVDKYMTQVDAYQRKRDLVDTPERKAIFDVLIEAQIEKSELWMEARRIIFFENGYRIRKLNQAYFAFYGGYQAGDRPGVGGDDPIGPAVQEIRAMSPSLYDFIVTMRGITSREELLAVRDEMRLTDQSS